MNEHYCTGKKNKGGYDYSNLHTRRAAYNVINLEYERSNEGSLLKERDTDAKVRQLMRSKNLDTRANCGYNVLTGNFKASDSSRGGEANCRCSLPRQIQPTPATCSHRCPDRFWRRRRRLWWCTAALRNAIPAVPVRTARGLCSCCAAVIRYASSVRSWRNANGSPYICRPVRWRNGGSSLS